MTIYCYDYGLMLLDYVTLYQSGLTSTPPGPYNIGKPGGQSGPAVERTKAQPVRA